MGIRLGSILVLLTVFALNAVSDDSTGRKVFLNGSIYSMDDTGSQFAAMVVEGGKIVYLGDDSTAMAWAQDTSEVTSAGRQNRIAGFYRYPYSHHGYFAPDGRGDAVPISKRR